MVNLSRLVLIHCFILAGMPQPVTANPPELLGEALRRYEKREEQLNPVWVKYQLKIHETKDWLIGRPKDLHGELRYDEEAEYARKGNKRRSWARSTYSRLEEWQRERFIIFNGEVTIGNGGIAEQQYWVMKKFSKEQVVESPFEIAYESHFFTALRMWAGDKKAAVLQSCTSSDETGEQVVLIELLYPSSRSRDKAWLLPGREWAIRRYQVINDLGVVTKEYETIEFRTINGVTYPKRGIVKCYLRKGPLGKTIEFDVVSIETEARKIPDRLFQFALPKNSSIWDRDLNVRVRSSEVAQTHLDEVVRRAAPPRFVWLPWVLGTFAGLGVIGVGVWWVRRVRRRKETQTG